MFHNDHTHESASREGMCFLLNVYRPIYSKNKEVEECVRKAAMSYNQRHSVDVEKFETVMA